MSEVSYKDLEAEVVEIKQQLDRAMLLIHGDGFALTGLVDRVIQSEKLIEENKRLNTEIVNELKQQRYIQLVILVIGIILLTGREIADVLSVIVGG